MVASYFINEIAYDISPPPSKNLEASCINNSKSLKTIDSGDTIVANNTSISQIHNDNFTSNSMQNLVVTNDIKDYNGVANDTSVYGKYMEKIKANRDYEKNDQKFDTKELFVKELKPIEFSLPKKKFKNWSILRNLLYRFFTVYRLINITVLTINVLFFIYYFFFTNTKDKLEFLSSSQITLIILINMSISVFIRNQFVQNFLFWLVLQIPLSAPLSIRFQFSKVYQLGGLHSGCAMGAYFWLFVLTITLTKDYINKQVSLCTLVLNFLLLSFITTIIIFAMPKLREKFHNSFQATHRFCGWTSLLILWSFTISFTNDLNKMLNIRQSTNRSDPIPLWKSLLSSPEFYLITSICCSILTPWLFLRKIKIESKRLSSKAILLTFPNSRKTFCGSAVAISHSPFGEYHAFATIKTPKKKGYRIIVAKAGDWTTDLIEYPRNEIWIKGVPTAGMMRVEKLFKRVLYVCTGSGIGPILPHILRKHPEKSKLLWICSEPEATFGQELVNEIKSNAGLDAVIHNTRTQGRLNLVKTSISMYQEINAETILVVSNPAFTAQLSYGCNARGIRCLGVIFDS